MSLIVLEPGLDFRIVDLGRPRTRSLGVPVGGAADRRSFVLGNALLGNPPDAAALEFTLKGPRLRAESDVGCVIFGAPFDAFRGDQRVEVGKSFTLRAGEELRIGGTTLGARAYLCVCGGFDAPLILASRSGLVNVQGGELLACAASHIRGRSCPAIRPEFFDETTPIMAIPGPQASWFGESDFYEQEFTVTPASNRMGLRLTGESLKMPKREMTSEPVAPGAVQVTNDGQCIILGVDGQTIGGYPKIAHVILANLDMLGQLRPGSRIRFERATLEEAMARDREAESDLRQWMLRLHLSLDAFPGERRFASL
jgi:biotin-dependent carboxylase-like uncharacterized protein